MVSRLAQVDSRTAMSSTVTSELMGYHSSKCQRAMVGTNSMWSASNSTEASYGAIMALSVAMPRSRLHPRRTVFVRPRITSPPDPKRRTVADLLATIGVRLQAILGVPLTRGIRGCVGKRSKCTSTREELVLVGWVVGFGWLVEAMGLEPTNLLTASQALYQLSYAPSGGSER